MSPLLKLKVCFSCQVNIIPPQATTAKVTILYELKVGNVIIIITTTTTTIIIIIINITTIIIITINITTIIIIITITCLLYTSDAADE